MEKIILFISSILIANAAFAQTKCFLATENNQIIKQEGECKSRHAPCSTFKIPLSVMGFNEGILIDENHPELPFQQGYDDWLEVWKQPQNPTTWMKNSCVWYSQVLTPKLGLQKFKHYLEKFNYGNQDVSGDKGKNNGLTHSWLSSSLQISPEEQITFLQKLINNQLPVSQKSHEMTRKLLYHEVLSNGWKLYGKTGSGFYLNSDGSYNRERGFGWFVGWIEKGDRKIAFVHYIEDEHKMETYAGLRAKEEARIYLRKLDAL